MKMPNLETDHKRELNGVVVAVFDVPRRCRRIGCASR